MTEATTPAASESVRSAIASRKLWYHTIEVAPGIVTPGWFDLRPVVELMPWPDVRGKRCLDVGPYDGFLSFELERRGAVEVVAADIADPAEWDWPIALREQGPEALRQVSGADPGGGFEIAKELLGSSVQRVETSIYDLSPKTVGEFDIVVCGSLLLHLKDPVSGLEAIRSICRESFLSAEQISPALTLLSRKRPLAQLRGGDRLQWTIPNAAGHRKLLRAAGFVPERASRPYAIPLGRGHRSYGKPSRKALPGQVLTGLVARGQGMAHVAVLAHPG